MEKNIVIEIKKNLIKENREGDRPCRNWGLAYVQTNDLIGRLGSLVTEAELGDNPLIETEETCLLKAGQKCGKCIES